MSREELILVLVLFTTLVGKENFLRAKHLDLSRLHSPNTGNQEDSTVSATVLNPKAVV